MSQGNLKIKRMIRNQYEVHTMGLDHSPAKNQAWRMPRTHRDLNILEIAKERSRWELSKLGTGLLCTRNRLTVPFRRYSGDETVSYARCSQTKGKVNISLLARRTSVARDLASSPADLDEILI